MQKQLLLFVGFILLIASCVPKTATKKPADLSAKVNPVYNAFVVRDKINMRAEATARSAKVAQVHNGTEVRVQKNENGWYKVVTADDKTGWIRSDFVGPASLSYAVLVTEFSENTLKSHKTELFIDENNPYSVIYLVLPASYYEDKTSARSYAEEIGKRYQEEVYPGTVEIRIMEPDKKKLFTRRTLQAIGPVGLKAPFVRSGRLFSFERRNGNEIAIRLLVPAELTEDHFVKMAEEIASKYGDSISKIEIFFVENTVDGLQYYTQNEYTPQNPNTCRLYYIEDAQGMDYKSNFCK